MTVNDFIFSKKPKYRFARHLIFWLVVYLPHLGISITSFVKYDQHFIINWPLIIKWQFIYLTSLTADIFYTYVIIYYLIPRYLRKKKYVTFVFQVIILTGIVFVLSGIAAVWHFDHLNQPFLLNVWLHFLIFTNSGPIVRFGLFLFVKELKSYYVKSEENISLVKENGYAELQLLKSQVHPHFLFNTLNNIYSLALNKSPIAGPLVAKLSSMFKYMINDCEEPLVSLNKELKLIHDYISLEKIRYGTRLNLRIEIKGNADNKFIAPLLMIPFIENSFKHGTSKVIENAWIEFRLIIHDSYLEFHLSNGKPIEAVPNTFKGGLGLRNVQKRLQLLYPGQYMLRLDDKDQIFSVDMTLPLQYEELRKAV